MIRRIPFLVGVIGIVSEILIIYLYNTFLVRDDNGYRYFVYGYRYFVYFDIKNQIFEIDNNISL